MWSVPKNSLFFSPVMLSFSRWCFLSIFVPVEKICMCVTIDYVCQSATVAVATCRDVRQKLSRDVHANDVSITFCISDYLEHFVLKFSRHKRFHVIHDSVSMKQVGAKV